MIEVKEKEGSAGLRPGELELEHGPFAPVFRYFGVFRDACGVDILADLPRLRAWSEELAVRPSVREAVTSDYPERLRVFIEKRQSYLSSLLPS